MEAIKAHILVQQGLQNVSTFEHRDYEPEEIDLQLVKSMYKVIDNIMKPQNQIEEFEVNQEVLDRLQVLIKFAILADKNTIDDEVSFNLPENYFHAIRIKTNTISNDYCMINCNSIKEGQAYTLLSGKIMYNGIEYVKNQILIGVKDVTTFSIIPTSERVSLGQKFTVNSKVRLTKSNKISVLAFSSFGKSTIKSPIAFINNNKLTFVVNNFDINSPILWYIRKPLEISLENNIGFELPDDVCYEIINDAVLELMIDSEQSNNKISNKSNIRNV